MADSEEHSVAARDSALHLVLLNGFVFGLVLASVCLAVATLVDSSAPYAVVGLNRFSPGLRLGAIFAIGLSFVAGFALAIAARTRGPAALERLGRLRQFVLPLSLAALLPGLFLRTLWHAREIYLLAFAGALALILERMLRAPIALARGWRPPSFRFWQNPKLRAWLPRVLLAVCIAWYVIAISRLVLLSHARMSTNSSDLAEFDNLFFNALHGHPFRAPAIDGDLRDWSALKIHAEFLLYLLLPFYAIRPGAPALLVIQTVIVAATALPIYLFAARRLGRWGGVSFAFVYLLWPAVERPNFFDFHFTPLGMLFVAWTLYCLDRVLEASAGKARKRALAVFGVVFVLALLSREDVAIGLGIFGLVVAISGLEPRLGLGMTLVAGVYAALVLSLKEHEGPGFFYLMYEQLQVPGEVGRASIVKTVLTNPVFTLTRQMTENKLTYLLFMLVPVGFLWARRWYLALALLPAVPFTLLVTDRVMVTETPFQYTYLWVPYVIFASVIGLERIAATDPARKHAATAALVFVAVIVSFHYGALLGAGTIRGGPNEIALSMRPADHARLADLEALARQVPPDASVAATEREGPHLSNRVAFYSLKTTLGTDTDYVLYGRRVDVRDERQNVMRALQSGKYGLEAARGEFRLLRRGASTAHNAELAAALESERMPKR